MELRNGLRAIASLLGTNESINSVVAAIEQHECFAASS